VAGALFTLGMMLYASQPWSEQGAGGWLALAAFAAFALSPYAVLALAARRADPHPARAWILLAVGVLVTVTAAWFYVLGFLVEPDPQSGLLFVFLPIYQLIAGGVIGLALALLVAAARRMR
jgi:hypothetical protein